MVACWPPVFTQRMVADSCSLTRTVKLCAFDAAVGAHPQRPRLLMSKR